MLPRTNVGHMKQTIISCFLLLRLSQYHVSTVWSGMESFSWRDKAVEITLPVSCRGFDKIKEGDDFLRSRYLENVRGSRKNWEMIVVRKIVVEDGKLDFDCF